MISLANGDPLLLEQRTGAGKVMLLPSSADRDWTDLPVKTVYLPLRQSLTQYLAGGKRGILDGGIAVGATKEISLPPSYVGKSLKVTKPNKQQTETPIVGEKDRSKAEITENDRAGIYRLALPGGADKDAGMATLYAVNPPFLDSRLDRIGERDLQAKLAPIRAEVIADAPRTAATHDLAFPCGLAL